MPLRRPRTVVDRGMWKPTTTQLSAGTSRSVIRQPSRTSRGQSRASQRSISTDWAMPVAPSGGNDHAGTNPGMGGL